MGIGRYMAATVVLLLKRIALLLGIYSLCRIGFFMFNQQLFPWVDSGELIKLLVLGLRFDLAVLAIINAPFILISLFPLGRISEKRAQTILFYFFILTNCFPLLLNCIDFEYYRFINKRSTSHLFTFIGMGDDVLRLLPRFLWDYWYVAAGWALLTLLLIMGYRRLSLPACPERPGVPYYAGQSLVFILGILVIIVSIRGGLQDTPISLKTAAGMAGPRNVALVINTPFSIISTLGHHHLELKSYFSETELNEKMRIYQHTPRSAEPFQPKNVVVFIMESFSREYMGPPYGEENLTPFLDSLAAKGLFCSRAFANGTDSISGIPAVVAGIPSLMTTPFISSPYSANRTDGLAVLLAAKGYHTAFFHGAKRGSLDLDAFSAGAGFETYWGLDDFVQNDRYQGRWGEHDKAFVKQVAGLWGVHDDPFFQYVAEKIHGQPRPFLAVIFSLSSHHPYMLPPEVADQFPEGAHPIHRTIRYADRSLQHFFETAASLDWYPNTLFIITADHTAQARTPFYQSRVGRYAVPLIFFCPGDPQLQGVHRRVAQQIDILPSVLDYLHYDRPFFGFGRSIFDEKQPGQALSFQEDVYQLIQGDLVLHFTGERSMALYDYIKDPDLADNLIPSRPDISAELEEGLKSFIQIYNQALIRNQTALHRQQAAN